LLEEQESNRLARETGNAEDDRGDRVRKRRLSLIFVGILAIGLIGGGCGGDSGDESGTPTDASADLGEGQQEIVIKTRLHIPAQPGKTVTGEVLEGSSIGDSPFCTGGSFRDQRGNPEIGSVDRSLTCSDGNLRIGFSPGTLQNHSQTGPWKVVSGTGAYEGLRGHGKMVVKYASGYRDLPKGSETFTGTASR
jgi:hypothetical protein